MKETFQCDDSKFKAEKSALVLRKRVEEIIQGNAVNDFGVLWYAWRYHWDIGIDTTDNVKHNLLGYIASQKIIHQEKLSL